MPDDILERAAKALAAFDTSDAKPGDGRTGEARKLYRRRQTLNLGRVAPSLVRDLMAEVERLRGIEAATIKWLDTDNASAGDWERLYEAVGRATPPQRQDGQ